MREYFSKSWAVNKPYPLNEAEAVAVYECAYQGALETGDRFWYMNSYGTESWGYHAMEKARAILLAGIKDALVEVEALSTSPYPEAGSAPGASFVTRWSRGPSTATSAGGVTYSDRPWTGCRSDGIEQWVHTAQFGQINLWHHKWQLPPKKVLTPREILAIAATGSSDYSYQRAVEALAVEGGVKRHNFESVREFNQKNSHRLGEVVCELRYFPYCGAGGWYPVWAKVTANGDLIAVEMSWY